MGKRMIITFITVLILIMSSTWIYAEVPVSSERTTVVNLLPEITIYMDTDQKTEIKKENTKVFVNESETEIESAEIFKNTGEGITYFILVDVSKSIKETDFDAVKKGVLDFGENLTLKDKVYLIPFGESVYSQEEAYSPKGKDFADAVNGLELKDDYTQLYTAVDSIVKIVNEDKDFSYPQRNIAIVFTDGVDDTEGGQITGEEAKNGMLDAGIPLYGFAVGEDKVGKDELGTFCRSLNGSLKSVNKNTMSEELSKLTEVLNNTVVIKADVKNSEDIVNSFDLRVQVNGEKDIVVKNDIKAHKDADSKDYMGVAVKKFIFKYWWIITIVAAALIVFTALTVIKRNRGIVTVDGKVVYGSKVQKKYHVQMKQHHMKQLEVIVNVNGGRSMEQKINVVESIIVGRASICDMYFDDENMSRQHFSVEIINDELYIDDLESTGGTYLNGVRVYTKQRLNKGDIVTAGKTQIKLNW